MNPYISAGGGGNASADDRAAGMTLMAGPTDDATVLVSKPPLQPLLLTVAPRWSGLAASEIFAFVDDAVGDRGSPSVSESL